MPPLAIYASDSSNVLDNARQSLPDRARGRVGGEKLDAHGRISPDTLPATDLDNMDAANSFQTFSGRTEMPMNHHNPSRRRFVRQSSLLISGLPLALSGSKAWAG